MTCPTTPTVAVNATDAGSRARPRLFHGWKVVSAGAVMLTLQSALILQAFGNYAVILREQFGWSTTTISIAYSSNRSESGLLGPIQGWALNRFGSRAVMRFGALVALIGFVWFSRMNTPVEFVISFFLISAGAGFAGFITVVTETVHWFERKRAMALSLSSGGFALGGLLIPLVVLSMRHFGWRQTALVSGLLLVVLTFVLSTWFGHTPAELGQPIDGVEPATDGNGVAAPADTSWHFTVREAVRSRAFWLLAFAHASALLVVGAVMAHLALYLTGEQGYSLQAASFVVAGVTIAQIAGQVVGGYLGDRTSKRWLSVAAMGGHVTGLLLLAFATGPWMIWGFAVLHGLAWGARGPLMSAIRADYFGSTAFGQIMGYSSIILMFGMIGGPLIAGILADVTGSYQAGFTILAVLAAFGGLLFAAAVPPPRRAPSPQAQPA